MLRIWKQFRVEIVALILFILGVFFLIEDYDIRETLYAWADSSWDSGRALARRAYRAALNQYDNTSVSDLIGIGMVAGAVMFITWRLRWHVLHADYWTRRACPVCGGPIARIRRTRLDRLIGNVLSLPLYRYLCRNPECRWQGRRYGSHRLYQIHPSEYPDTVFRGKEVADVERLSPNGAGEDAKVESEIEPDVASGVEEDGLQEEKWDRQRDQ